VVAIFPMLGELATTVEPGDGALDDPALGLDDEAFGVIAASDDFRLLTRHGIAASSTWCARSRQTRHRGRQIGLLRRSFGAPIDHGPGYERTRARSIPPLHDGRLVFRQASWIEAKVR
jgi:hypothetical protein